jgi:hypothetical protein
MDGQMTVKVLNCSSVLLVACRTGVALRVLALSISRPGDCSCVSQEAAELLRAAQVASQARGSTPPIVTSTDTDNRTKLPRSVDRAISSGACPAYCIVLGQQVVEISKEKFGLSHL